MPAINGKTKLAGVIGWPLDHSLSPAMHNAVYGELGLDWVYLPLPVSDEVGLRRVVAAIRALPFVGFNITMPYKTAMIDLCDEVAMAAKMAGAVNAVQCVDGRLIGYNTDGRGLVESLELDTGITLEGKRVVLLGAGGAAGAALVAFELGKADDVVVVNRDIIRAEELVARIEPHLRNARIRTLASEAAEQAVGFADLIVNATSLGMRRGDPSPIPVEWLHSGQVVFDMVYGAPEATALVQGARSAGATAVDGLGMLVAQGAIAVDIWNESKQVPTSRATMRFAAEQQLRARVTGAMNP